VCKIALHLHAKLGWTRCNTSFDWLDNETLYM